MKLFILTGLLLIRLWVAGQAGTLVWEDNFDEGKLDPARWSIETGTGVNGDWGTGQLDRATGRLQNINFLDSVPGADNGCLVITTRRENYIDRNYTSGRIITAGKASWGPGHRITARIYPRDIKYKGQGFAFWLMPDEVPEGWNYLMWPQGGEVDIMEYVGSIPYHNLGGVHYAWFWENNQWQAWNHGHQAAYYSFESRQVPFPYEPGPGKYPPDDDDPFAGSSGFHVYGIDWYSDRMEFFIDSIVYHIHYFNDGVAFLKDGKDKLSYITRDNRRTGISEYSNHFSEWYPFEHRMYAILSAGVGGSQTTYGGSIVPEAIFPCSVFIDWVRVYKLDDVKVGVQKHENPRHYNIYPNPAGKVLHIGTVHSESYELNLFDLSGNIILHKNLVGSNTINVTEIAKGNYVILIQSGNRSTSRKIVIR